MKIIRPFCMGVAVLFMIIYGIVMTVVYGALVLGVQIFKVFRRE